MDNNSVSENGVNNEQKLEVRWWHIVIGLGLVLILVALLPQGKSPEFSHLTEGSISDRKIIAPFDFEILKAADELKKERAEAAQTVLPVISRADTIREARTRELIRFASESHKLLSTLSHRELSVLTDTATFALDASELFVKLQDDLFRKFKFRLSAESWLFLVRLYEKDKLHNPGLYFQYFERSLSALLLDVYATGVVDRPKEQIYHPTGNVIIQDTGEEYIVSLDRLFTASDALERLSELLPKRLSGGGYPSNAVSASYAILQTFIVPNAFYETVETARRRQMAVAKVPLAKGLVKKDELIIDRNIKVSRDVLDKLSSLATKRVELQVETGGLRAYLPTVGNFMLIGLIIILLGLFLALSKREVWDDWKLLLLLAIIIAMIHTFQSQVSVKYDLSRYMFPIAVGAMLVSILIDRSVAMVAVGVIALLAGLMRGHDYMSVVNTAVVGGAALLGVRYVHTRSDVMRVSLYLLGAYLPLVLSFYFVRYQAGQPIWADAAVALSSIILSPMLVVGFVYIFENLFKITTDLSLLELIDLNRPLLRELALKAPGTYHHSIMVGSLAEAAARAIGANALLTRAGAYYHDIGKIGHKEYFIENQESGSENIHDSLPPSRSAAVLIDHVTYGLELADKYGLPPQIKAFISEHHGKSRLAYFYAKAKEEKGNNVPEAEYRYPGPNPQNKETGILMLADVTEAATRSMDHPTSKEIKSRVDELVKTRLSEGDLDTCPLTLKEISQIKDAFMQVLMGIYHQRIKYPKASEQIETEAAEENRINSEEMITQVEPENNAMLENTENVTQGTDRNRN